MMIKNVGQSIPSYIMWCFLLPTSLCGKIERILNGYWWRSSGNSSGGVRWMGWNKMSVPKCQGGLGFRDLHGFNLALLGKHIWNMCNKPTSLVSKIFKARYFRDTHILQASKGCDSSFIWTGIWEAKEQLRAGFRWVLGDGKNIRVFKDPWIKGKKEFCVENNHLNVVRNDLACDYIHPNSKAWDVQKVQRDFHENNVQLVLQTRIPLLDAADRIAWCDTTNGGYTVKSGYHYWMNLNSEMPGNAFSKSWNRLWNLPIPHKIRTFLWHFCKNNVPVRKLLRSKGVGAPTICPMCDTDIEHLLHVFFDCKFASDCWQIAGLNFDILSVEWAPDWLLDKIMNENENTVVKIAEVLWCIWFGRNKKVWEGQCITPSVAMDITVKQVEDWQTAMARKASLTCISSNPAVQKRIAWSPPTLGRVKLNVDASIYSGAASFNIGMVIGMKKVSL